MRRHFFSHIGVHTQWRTSYSVFIFTSTSIDKAPILQCHTEIKTYPQAQQGGDEARARWADACSACARAQGQPNAAVAVVTGTHHPRVQLLENNILECSINLFVSVMSVEESSSLAIAISLRLMVLLPLGCHKVTENRFQHVPNQVPRTYCVWV